MFLAKRFLFVYPVLSVMGLLLAFPVVSKANDFTGFRVISESQNEVRLEIKSTYSGSHGPRAHVSVQPTISGQGASDIGYSTKNCMSSNGIEIGSNTTCITLSRVGGVGEVLTDGLQICMFDAVARNYIHCESFAYNKVWDRLSSDSESPTPPVQGGHLSDLAFNVLNMDPAPNMDDENQLQLYMNRSYQAKVTVVNKGDMDAPAFIVRTTCHRGDESSYNLGEHIVSNLSSGDSVDVSYDIYPSKAGEGNCLLRTLVDADNSVPEDDESEASNIWENTAVMQP